MTERPAYAKINLALTVGPQRGDGKHEILTVFQRLDLADRIAVEPSSGVVVDGFPDDTLVRTALAALAVRAGGERGWRATITKRIPVAAGLGGGSSDAAAALLLANATLPRPLPAAELRTVASGVGADVPFFLTEGPQLGSGDGSELEPLALPQDYAVVLVLPQGVRKESTGAVYRRFDERQGSRGFEERSRALRTTLAEIVTAGDLARLPRNDLASSPVAGQLERLGALRADVSGAGPAVYGVFRERSTATIAARELGDSGTTIIAAPAW
jgi:4-diphosphocytidyl-2-C-methyl-D-erythritol kinase